MEPLLWKIVLQFFKTLNEEIQFDLEMHFPKSKYIFTEKHIKMFI